MQANIAFSNHCVFSVFRKERAYFSINCSFRKKIRPMAFLSNAEQIWKSLHCGHLQYKVLMWLDKLLFKFIEYVLDKVLIVQFVLIIFQVRGCSNVGHYFGSQILCSMQLFNHSFAEFQCQVLIFLVLSLERE